MEMSSLCVNKLECCGHSRVQTSDKADQLTYWIVIVSDYSCIMLLRIGSSVAEGADRPG